ncbi:MAG: aminotransferase class I/II-fold pyridoxal phosphate-dependent enzyme, partial [Halanaerobiales bacterium]
MLVIKMWFNRMPLEIWFNQHQYEIEYDIGESSVKYSSLGDLDVNLEDLPLRYGYHKGKPELRRKISEIYDNLGPENILVTNGASEALFDIEATILKPGDQVIVAHPNYSSNYEVPRSLGCKVKFLNLEYDKKFKIDYNKLKDLIKPRTKLVSLTYPNNPTGAKISLETLKDIIDLIEKNDTYLLFDETYRERSFDNKIPPAATLSSNIISVSSMSKAFGLPGIRIGWLATQDKSMIESVLATREQVSICNSAFGEHIALNVLKDREKILENKRKHAQENLKVVDNWMKDQNNIEWIKPDAGVVAFPKI